MKRLQFRHHEEIFNNRADALQYFADIVDEGKRISEDFGESLYSEPMVAKYYVTDEGGNQSVKLILAIGIEGSKGEGVLAPYHIIDSAKIEEDIVSNKEEIDKIAEELAQEVINRKEEDENLLKQIEDNKVWIESVTPYGANVREEYILMCSAGTQLGASIKVYKDNALLDAQVLDSGVTGFEYDEDIKKYRPIYGDERWKDHEVLYILYRNEEGNITFVAIDYEKFILEEEFGKGLIVEDNIVSINLMDDEEFLEFNGDEKNASLKTVGIRDAINAASETTLIESKAYTDEKIIEESNERKASDNDLQSQITANKISSKDILTKSTETGTTLTIQVDDNTIIKTASAATIYETGVAVLGTALKLVEVEPKDTTIKSSYQLQGLDGVAIGDVINIYKDSALARVDVGYIGDIIDPVTGYYTERGTGNDALNFIYILNDGTYALTGIEISKYFNDAHFSSGLTNHDGYISITAGEGNEYLVVGTDSLSVIGVDAAIAKASGESYSASTADSKEYFDHELNIFSGYVVNDITLLSGNTFNTFESLSANIISADEKILSESKAYTDESIQSLASGVSESFATKDELKNTESALTHNLSDLSGYVVTDITILSGNAFNAIDSLSGNTYRAIDAVIENTANSIESLSANVISSDEKVLETAKTYADEKKEEAILASVDEVNAHKVIEVVYDSGNHIVRLKKADGTVTDGFDATDFIKDGMLDRAYLDVDTNELVLIWNTESEKDETRISLSKFANIYTSGNDFIKISDYVITARVDGADGYANTIASTDFAKNMANEALVDSKTYTDILSAATFTEIEAIKSNSLEKSFSASVVSYIDAADKSIATQVSANTSSLDILQNGGYGAPGSILFRVNEALDHVMLTDGYVETVDATHSLLRVVNDGLDENIFYISSKASDMFYVKKDGSAVGLNDYITEIETRIYDLETNLEEKVKNILKNILVGTEGEIKVTPTEGNIVIGFADDAIFGKND